MYLAAEPIRAGSACRSVPSRQVNLGASANYSWVFLRNARSRYPLPAMYGWWSHWLWRSCARLMLLGLLGEKIPKYRDIADVLVPPWPAVAQCRELLLHRQHPGNAHGRNRDSVEQPGQLTK
jgi:hypothetical protein